MAAPCLAARAAALLSLAVFLASCDRREDRGPVVVSVIGGTPAFADSSRGRQSESARLFTDSAAQGLVRFDAAGQIVPGLAERWIVTEGGVSYIFRLRGATWSDGATVTAADAVTILRRQLDGASRNPLRPFLSAIDEVVEMTPEVIEIRLRRPRPDLLKLFAQPELALVRLRPPSGSGPFRIVRRDATGVLLRPAPDPDRSPDDESERPDARDDVQLIGERAAMGLARFTARRSDLVTGGTVDDFPLLDAAGVAPVNRRLDPASGLFGLAVARRRGFLADPAGRAAVAAAFDRSALTAAFTAEWPTADQILPDQLDSAALPARGDWADLPPDDRLAAAKSRVAAWQAANGPITLQIALPAGPGGTILFALLARDLRSVGIASARAVPAGTADLRLIDQVAPYDSARWYLATACQPCSAEATSALQAARDAATLRARATHIAEADAALAGDVAFIPLARPLRWSAVAMRLQGWQSNVRAWHPLNQLREAPK